MTEFRQIGNDEIAKLLHIVGDTVMLEVEVTVERIGNMSSVVTVEEWDGGRINISVPSYRLLDAANAKTFGPDTGKAEDQGPDVPEGLS